MNCKERTTVRVSLAILAVLLTVVYLTRPLQAQHDAVAPGEPVHAFTIDDPDHEGMMLVCGAPYSILHSDSTEWIEEAMCIRVRKQTVPMRCELLEPPKYIKCEAEL